MLLTIVLVLAALALLELNVLILTWIVRVWRDDRDECRARDLERSLVQALAQLRDQAKQLAKLECVAAAVQRHLWGSNRN